MVLANARFDPFDGKVHWRQEIRNTSAENLGSATQWNTVPYQDSLLDPVEGPSPDTIRLQQLFQSLPVELQIAIANEFLESAFHPQKMFPVLLPTCWNTNFVPHGPYQPPNPHALRALNEPEYTEYQAVFYSQNVWVIESGLESYALQFLTDLSEENLARIKRVELAFTIQDGSCREWLFPDMDPGCTEFVHPLDRLACFRGRCEEEEWLLLDIWWKKFERITELDLTHLTLDYREAFNPYGEFIGVDLTETLPCFVHGIPEHFEILAPTNSLMSDILDIFIGKHL